MKLRLIPACLLLCFCAAARQPYMDRWRAVADRLITTPPESYPFNWGEGVQLIGLMKIHERTRDARYADYVEKWAARFDAAAAGRILREGLNPPRSRAGYCGHWSPATALFYLDRVRRKPEHLRIAEEVIGYIRNTAERSPEGALGHWQGSHQLWVDTLYMACPLLAAFGSPDEAARQVILFARPLQDEKTGLFYHMWDWQTRQRSPDLWGRGNGWVLMSIADSFDGLRKKHPQYRELKAIAEKLARGLQTTQDADGLWHTVMNDHTAYAESSATMMVTYGLLKLVRLKILPRAYREPALRAWKAVNEKYVKDGVVTGVSAGTGPGDRASYIARAVGTETWGTGAYLMAGSEVDRLK
ncbi:MAG: glycoside hydrolase family 88 protein [Acidobacteriota bacterium]